MKAYYINRNDRLDRNYLFRGAMAATGFRPENLIRVIAKHKEDYPTRQILCDAAAADGFPEFFGYQRDKIWPGYGHLVCSWSVMRCWRTIANSGETAIQLLDDYYLKKDISELQQLINDLGDVQILQLAWHTRDDVFFKDEYKLGLPYRAEEPERSQKSDHVYVGAARGCSDWALVLSPEGAQLLLDYMRLQPYLNTECVITGLHFAFKEIRGIYSIVQNNPKVNGTVELQPEDNYWIGHLVAYTEGDMSDLIGTHEETDL